MITIENTHKELPLWKKAYDIGNTVHRLTKEIPQYTTMIQLLREKTAALPVAVTMSTLATSPVAHADALKDVYELAHDAEYVLFFCLIFKYLHYNDIGLLRSALAEVKQLVIETTEQTMAVVS